MEKKKRVFYCFLLFLFFIFALALRFYKFGEIPVGLNRDEASIGYTAYSLLKTGKDEYGKSFPLSFKSFGDWKLPLYSYLVIPFIKLFGLSDFAVRFPSAVFGILTVLATYFLVKELFSDLASQHPKISVSLIASFLLAISPWHIHFSRAAYEANVALFLTVLGVYFFVRGLKKAKFLLPSGLCFALTLFTYHGAHVFVPPFVVGLILLFRKKIILNRWSVLALGLFLVLAFVSFHLTLLEADVTKISGIGFFSDPVLIHRDINILRVVHRDSWGRVFHNKLVFLGTSLLRNYLNCFSFDFLYFEGGAHPIHNIPHFGNFYKIELLFLSLGFIYLVKAKFGAKKLILLWLLLSPLPSSITKDAPNSVRMLCGLPSFQMIEALGVVFLLGFFKNKPAKFFVFCSLFSILGFELFQFADFYFVHFPKERAVNWGGEYRNLVSFISQQDAEKVKMEKPSYSPYIYFLFYQRKDPEDFINSVVYYPETSDGFFHVKSFANFEFRKIREEDFQKDGQFLIFWGEDVSENFLEDKKGFLKKTFYLPDGKPHFYVFNTSLE